MSTLINFLKYYVGHDGLIILSIALHIDLISDTDYDFLYELWNNGVSSYDNKMKERLNKIRNLYKDNNTL